MSNKTFVNKEIKSMEELFKYSGEDYYFFFRRKTISIKDSGHIIFRFDMTKEIGNEILNLINSRGKDIKDPNIGFKPFRINYNDEILRFKLNYRDGKLSSINFRKSKGIYDFESFLNHSLFLKFLQQLFLKGKAFIFAGETGSGKTTTIVSLFKFLNENNIEEFKRKGYINLLKNNQIPIDESLSFEEVIEGIGKYYGAENFENRIAELDKAIMANPMVPIIEKMQDTFIYTLENPVEYDFVKNSKYIDFEQIETDDYNQYLTSTVTVNPNLVYVSEVREAIEYNDFLFVAKQGKMTCTTNHASSVFHNISKIVSYIGGDNKERAKEDIASGIGGFIHFNRYYPEGYYEIDQVTKKIQQKEFGFSEEIINGESFLQKDSIFISSYEYLSLMDESINTLFKNEPDIETFKTRVLNSYFYIPTGDTLKEEGQNILLYLPHEVSLLYNLFGIYKKRKIIPKINVYGLKFNGTIRGALEHAFLYYGKDKEILREFLEYFKLIYHADLEE